MASIVAVPLYSMPHFNLTITSFPVRFAKKGLGFTIYCRQWRRVNDILSHSKYIDLGVLDGIEVGSWDVPTWFALTICAWIHYRKEIIYCLVLVGVGIVLLLVLLYLKGNPDPQRETVNYFISYPRQSQNRNLLNPEPWTLNSSWSLSIWAQLSDAHRREGSSTSTKIEFNSFPLVYVKIVSAASSLSFPTPLSPGKLINIKELQLRLRLPNALLPNPSTNRQ